MSAPKGERQPATLRVQELLGRVVVDAAGRRLGRVVECIAEPWGEELRVVALLVGPGAWWGRFGPAAVDGRRVRWEEIAALSPHITLHPGTDNREMEG
jgi:sporulation protein YlmC with PRC-barrel domain